MSSDNNTASSHLAAAAAAATAAQADSPQQQTTQPTAGAQTASGIPVTSDFHRCQWEGCGERFNGPETLYEHICDRHIGRKSTNNLNLECHWANCKTKTVKRDHITSHVRVHVPHKPHRCPICNKAFKRPQDLKKHHKTHAEDSGSPNQTSNGQGPNGHPGGHPGHNGYGGMGGATPGPGAFYTHMQGGVGMNFGGYQAPPGAYYTQPPHTMGGQYAGSVYYSGNGGNGTQASYARHENGVQALDNLLGAIKQQSFDATSYAEFGPALVQMHGVTLPPPIATHGVDYGAPQLDYAQPVHQLSNVRRKDDLLIIKERLQTMMNAVETEERGSVAAAAQHINYSTPHLQSTYQHGAATSEQTPVLTPGSSAMSYSPGQSPSSDHSSMAAIPSGVASYPHLQGAAILASGQGASVPTLGHQYNPNAQLRHTGGRLTRAAPGPESVSPTTKPTKKRSSRVKRERAERDVNIDPALTGSVFGSSSGSSEHTATPGTEAPSAEEPSWLRDVRILENLLQLVQGMLSNGQYEDGAEAEEARSGDSEMEDVKQEISYPELSALSK